MAEARELAVEPRALAHAGAAAAGMAIFALFSGRGWPWTAAGIAGFLAAAFFIQRSCPSLRGALSLFGLSLYPAKTLILSLPGCALGIGLGIAYRWNFRMPAFPGAGLRPFAIAACAIGAAEELLYRGWMQGRLRTRGAANGILSLLLAAAAHTAYKAALFVFSPAPAGIDFTILISWTFGVGVLFGLLRELSRNVIPAAAAHASFDLLVYGTAAEAPWWVWA